MQNFAKRPNFREHFFYISLETIVFSLIRQNQHYTWCPTSYQIVYSSKHVILGTNQKIKKNNKSFFLNVFRVLSAYFGVQAWRYSNMIWDALYQNSFVPSFLFYNQLLHSRLCTVNCIRVLPPDSREITKLCSIFNPL